MPGITFTPTDNDDDDDGEWTELDDMLATPSFEIYKPLQEAFGLFNHVLFADAIPDCMITLQRKDHRSQGYHIHNVFMRTGGNRQRVSVIALNPTFFAEQRGGTLEALQTLVHEMCHAWQWHHGTPSRKGYHNREWAEKMIEVGLQPSSTGKPGGKMVGQKIADYIIAGGRFESYAREMIKDGFDLPWAEAEDFLGAKVPTRISYVCPACGLKVMGKRGIASLKCDCDGTDHRMEGVTEATATPSVLHNTDTDI